MLIISGSTCVKLGSLIGHTLQVPCIQADVSCFSDGELRVHVNAHLKGEAVVILQSTSSPCNDHLMELFFLIETARQGGANHITVVIPYFGYGRQDRVFVKEEGKHSPISAKLVASLLEKAGADSCITLDCHSQHISTYFRIPFQNISPASLFVPLLAVSQNHRSVSCDAGGYRRALDLGQRLQIEVAHVQKTRNSFGECEVVIGSLDKVQGKHCIVIDDIIDTGNTLCKTAQFLMQEGAQSVTACVTHAVLSDENARRLIEKSVFSELHVTDSIEQKNLTKKMTVVSVHSLIAEALQSSFKLL